MTNIELIKADFKNFLYVIWLHLGLPEPTPVQYEIADYLQGKSKRRMIMAFRGVGKSWITSAYVLWRLLNDPDEKFLVVSASKGRSDDFSSFTKRLIREVPFLQHMKAGANQRDSMVSFDVSGARAAHAPSVKAAGISGQLAGSRATEIIADDVEVPNNSGTEDLREKLAKATTEFEAIIVPGGRITFLGTPQTEESVYNALPGRGYDVRIWPARYPSREKLTHYKGFLAQSLVNNLEDDYGFWVGKPTDPSRFTEVELSEREISYGRAGFLLQFMLDTSLSDAERYPLKTSDLIVMNCNQTKAPIFISYASSPDLQIKDIPNVGFTGDRFYRPFKVDSEWTDYTGSMMFIDPSGRGTDETGYAVIKYLHGYLFVTAAGGLKGGYDDGTLEALAKIAAEEAVNTVVIEANFGDGMYSELFKPVLRRHHNCAVEEVKHSTMKEARIIDTLEPILNRYKLIIDAAVVKADVEKAQVNHRYSLLWQLTHICRERGALKHDDALDALAGAVAYWVNYMARDQLKEKDLYLEAQLDVEIEKFLNSAIIFSGNSYDGVFGGGARRENLRWGINF